MIKYVSRLGLILLASLMLVLPSFQSLAQDGPQGLAKDIYDFPRDHRFHNDADYTNGRYLEWIYYTGIIRDENARQWGYQVTIFQAMPTGDKNLRAFLYDVALSDVENGQFLHHRLALPALGQVRNTPTGWKFDNGQLLVEYDETADSWILGYDGDLEDSAGTPIPVNFNFTLLNDKSDYYLHDPEDGISPIGECEQNFDTLEGYTYYYTHPAMTTTGILTVDDTTSSMTGDTWFDHQWGNFFHCRLAWDWFSLRLDNGDFLMIFSLLNSQGEFLNLLGMTYINHETGSAEYWTGADDVKLTPTNRVYVAPDSGTVFPIEWTVETPIGTYGVRPVFDSQAPPTLISLVPEYWEGLITVHEGGLDGEQIGEGYLEVAR